MVSGDYVAEVAVPDEVFRPETNEKLYEQQKALGSLWSRALPIATPRKQEEYRYSATNINFLYSKFVVGNALQKIRVLMRPPKDAPSTPTIVILIGLSGAGKTFVLHQLAITENAPFVVLMNCATASFLGTCISEAVSESKLPAKPSLIDPADVDRRYHKLEESIQTIVYAHIAGHLYVLRQLLKSKAISKPVEFLRYLDNGGYARIYNVCISIYKSLKKSDIGAIINQCTSDIKGGIILAWDEAQALMPMAEGLVKHHAHPMLTTTVDPSSGALINGTSAFSVVIRVLAQFASMTSFLSGTAIKLNEAEQAASGVLKKLVKIFSEFKPMDFRDIFDFINYHIPNFWVKLKEATKRILLTQITGRPRIPATFLCIVLLKIVEVGIDNIDSTNIENIVVNALADTVDDLEQYLAARWSSFGDFMTVGQATLSKKEVFERLLVGDKLMLDLEQFDKVQQCFMYLEKDTDDTSRCTSREPLIMEAIKRLFRTRKVTRAGIATKHYQVAMESEGPRASAKGPRAEMTFMYALLELVDRCKGKEIPITDFDLFQPLRGTIFDEYCLKVTDLVLSPNAWEDLMTPSKEAEKPWAKNVKELCGGLDTRFRPDILCLLQRIGDPKDVIPLTVGARCYSTAQSPTDFCKNLMTLDLQRAFLNDKSDILDVWRRQTLKQLYTVFAGKPSLRIAFVYGGVSPTIDTSTKIWLDTESKAQYLIVDFRNKGLADLLPAATISLLNEYCAISQAPTSLNMTTATATPAASLALNPHSTKTVNEALQEYKEEVREKLVKRVRDRYSNVQQSGAAKRRRSELRRTELSAAQLAAITQTAGQNNGQGLQYGINYTPNISPQSFNPFPAPQPFIQPPNLAPFSSIYTHNSTNAQQNVGLPIIQSHHLLQSPQLGSSQQNTHPGFYQYIPSFPPQNQHTPSFPPQNQYTSSFSPQNQQR